MNSAKDRFDRILGFVSIPGAEVLVCVGLMNVFAGTLSPITVAQQPTTGPSTAFHTTARTTDGKFTAALTVNPNIADPDAFDVMVAEAEMG